jgi:hypothetical protein
MKEITSYSSFCDPKPHNTVNPEPLNPCCRLVENKCGIAQERRVCAQNKRQKHQKTTQFVFVSSK